jgi:hypothetical protein
LDDFEIVRLNDLQYVFVLPLFPQGLLIFSFSYSLLTLFIHTIIYIHVIGLIKDVIGSALGADEPKNDIRNNNGYCSASSQSQYRSRDSSSVQQYSYGRELPRRSPDYSNYNGNSRQNYSYGRELPRRNPDHYNYDDNGRRGFYQQDDGMHSNDNKNNNKTYDDPPPYSVHQGPSPQVYNNGYNNGHCLRGSSNNNFFRPLALPQLSYGNDQPFLRGYSNELQQYNISLDDFMQALDAINIAIIPNPENQIFPKGANIAGFFV